MSEEKKGVRELSVQEVQEYITFLEDKTRRLEKALQVIAELAAGEEQ